MSKHPRRSSARFVSPALTAALAGGAAALAATASAAEAEKAAAPADATTAVWKKAYGNDFSGAEVASEPEDLFILDGEFTVAEREGGNRVLALPGSPLDDFGFLVGERAVEGRAVQVRVQAERKGRRKPAFSVGLNGRSGFRLKVFPAKRAVLLTLGGDTVAEAPFEWETGSWVWLRLEVVPAGPEKWVARGKVWDRGKDEPAAWSVQVEVDKRPRAGKASVWGVPYSGKEILFDDLSLYSSLPPG